MFINIPFVFAGSKILQLRKYFESPCGLLLSKIEVARSHFWAPLATAKSHPCVYIYIYNIENIKLYIYNIENMKIHNKNITIFRNQK